MFSRLTLSNFQSFGEGSDVRLAPLTLIFGPNSAGKSSIGRALRYMQQSFSPSPLMHTNTFVANDFAVNLASYKNLVHNHDTDKVVRLGISTKSKRFNEAVFAILDNQLIELRLSGLFDIETPDGDIESRELSISFARDTDSSIGDGASWSLTEQSLTNFELILASEVAGAIRGLANYDPASPDPRIAVLLLGPLRSAKGLTEKSLEDLRQQVSTAFITSEAIIEAQNVSVSLFTPRLTSGEFYSPRQLDSIGREAGLSPMERRVLTLVERSWISLLGEIQDTLINKFNYVKPLRDIPERLHVVSNDESVLNSLAQDVEVRQKISDWLARITNNAYELDYIPMKSDTNDIFGDMGALVLKDKYLNTSVSFEDAGTGLSQVLPILAWLAKTSTLGEGNRSTPTVLIEQPELHLHPRMQGELFDLFAEVTSASKARTQIITETHSEAFLLRAQSAIREGRLKSSDVSIIYVDKAEGIGSVAFEIELSPDGDLTTPWPDTTNFSDIRFDQSR